MSMGKNKSSSTQEFDPELKGLLTETYRTGQRLSQMPYQSYDFATQAPMSPAQLEAMNRTADISRAGVGQDAVNDAVTATRDVMNFQPQQVSSTDVGSSNSFGPINNQTIGRAQAVDVRPTERVGEQAAFETQQISTAPIAAQQVQGQTVDAAQFDPNAMSRYTNPYEDQVVQQTISDLDRARQMTQNQNAASAVSAGAFGGDRQALLEAETDKNFLSEVGRQTGALRQAGYNQGAQMQQADLNRQQQAGMQTAQFGQQANLANQAQTLAADRASAGYDLQGQTETGRQALQSNLAANQQNTQRALANQRMSGMDAQLGLQSGMQANQLNQQSDAQNAANDLAAQRATQQGNIQAASLNQRADLANQDARMRAALANQNAGMQAARMNQGAAQQLAGLGGTMRGMQYGDAAQLQGVGDAQQAQGQRMLDDRYRRFLDEREYPYRQFDVLRSGAGILPNPLTSSSKGRGFNVGLPGGQ